MALRLPLFMILVGLAYSTTAQGVRGSGRPPLPEATVAKDSIQTAKDSTAVKSDITTTILYSAKDSINSNLVTKIVRLYGEAKITYGEIQLEAEEITIDYNESTLTAKGKLDSAGRRVGYRCLS